MILVLLLRIFGQVLSAARPVIGEGIVVRFLHELINSDEIEEAIGAFGRWGVRRHESVVHCREPLLTIENDVFRRTGAVAVGVNLFAGQRIEIFPFSLPQEQTPDVVIEKDRSHECANIPRFPLEFALEVWDDKPSFPQAIDQGGEAYMIWLLSVLHISSSPNFSSKSLLYSSPTGLRR